MDTIFRAYSLALAASLAAPRGLRFPAPASAQSYPSMPSRSSCLFPPADRWTLTARLLADKLSASLKQPFIVENWAGAAGNIGTEAVAKATPDGHTLLMVLDTPLTAHPALYPKLPFNPESDFVPISIVASFSQMLVVHPPSP